MVACEDGGVGEVGESTTACLGGEEWSTLAESVSEETVDQKVTQIAGWLEGEKRGLWKTLRLNGITENLGGQCVQEVGWRDSKWVETGDGKR